MNWIYLSLAIGCEVLATSALKATEGFTRWQPSVLVVLGYCLAFYFLSLTLRSIPVGVAYAIWSGVGVILISIVGVFFYQQKLDVAGFVGIGLIVAGVLVLQLFSKLVVH